jgi:hypothetical protein
MSMGSEMRASRPGSDVDAIVGAKVWQVHLGRSGGKLLTKEELEVAVARDEIGLETLVREPGAFSWTTAGAATGRSEPPESPPEPEQEHDGSIELSADVSVVEVATADPPEVARVEPSRAEPSSSSEAPFTREEIASAKPQPIGKAVVILACMAFVGGVVIAGRDSSPARAVITSATSSVGRTTATTAAPPAAPPPATIATSIAAATTPAPLAPAPQKAAAPTARAPAPAPAPEPKAIVPRPAPKAKPKTTTAPTTKNHV